jgi:uncharacterized flavoprotein (TIGR03862 family)
MAAQVCMNAGLRVEVFDAMPSVGRKFLLAGKGGLNLTHAEPWARFKLRYRERSKTLAPILDRFDAQAVRDWAHSLGVDTFIGSSNRVFPSSMKAAPMLRNWLSALRAEGLRIHVRHRWRSWSGTDAGVKLDFDTPSGPRAVSARAAVLALGGGSWPQLGSDGSWVPWLASEGVGVAPLRPANCGFERAGGWSEIFRAAHAGAPVKTVSIEFGGTRQRGEFVITESGVEGSLIYLFSGELRDAIEQDGCVDIHLDLLPDLGASQVHERLARPRGNQTLSNHLRRTLGLTGVKLGLLRECLQTDALYDPGVLASQIKRLRIRLDRPRPLAEAISSAGGVRFEAVNDALMLKTHPGVFVAGEMLDWEAPTGGYLLTACIATGHHAGRAVVDWLRRGRPPDAGSDEYVPPAHRPKANATNGP